VFGIFGKGDKYFCRKYSSLGIHNDELLPCHLEFRKSYGAHAGFVCRFTQCRYEFMGTWSVCGLEIINCFCLFKKLRAFFWFTDTILCEELYFGHLATSLYYCSLLAVLL
jgi:hypothetical protein